MIPDIPTSEPKLVQELPLSDIMEDPHNPRTVFDEAALQGLADTIRERGVQQPIHVRAHEIPGKYIIIQGARRYRASHLAGRTTIPAILVSEAESSHYDDYAQVIENLQRAELPALDMADFIRKRVDAGDRKQDIARKLGISPTVISHYLALHEAPEALRQAFLTGKIAGLRVLYDLVQLAAKSPDAAARLVATAEAGGKITRASIGAAAQAHTRANKTGKQEDIDDPILICELDGELVELLMLMPTAEGLGHVAHLKTGQREEVALERLICLQHHSRREAMRDPVLRHLLSPAG